MNEAIPEDFPRRPNPGAVGGAQPKFLARKIDGKFITGFTAEELAERYDLAQDLVEQLIPYSRQKLKEHPDWDATSFGPKLRKGIESKGWDITVAEIDWVVAHTLAELRVGKLNDE
jgi:hypothetical protein